MSTHEPMLNVDFNAYLAGGYFLLKSTVRDEQRSPHLLPNRLLSLSRCICPSVHLHWLWDQTEAQQQLGFPAARWSELRTWDSDRMEPPNVFLSLSAAQEFQRQFKLPTDHLHLIGIGLPAVLSTAFGRVRKQQRIPDPQSSGTAMLIRRQERLATNGQVLGFEIISYDNDLAHSWLCSGLEDTMHRLYAIQPNTHGLIATEQQAMQVYEWIAEDKQQGHRAEPEPYFPWLLVDYPLESI